MTSIKSFEDICNAFYINLDHRTDRKEHITEQLATLALTTCERFKAIKMENGAVGCSMSHLKILDDGRVTVYGKLPSVIHQWDRHNLTPHLINHYSDLYLKELGYVL